MADAEPAKAPDPHKVDYVPGDDGFTRWRNTFNLLLGRLTDEGVSEYIRKRDDRFEAEDCQRCEKHRDWLLQYSERFPSMGIRCALAIYSNGLALQVL